MTRSFGSFCSLLLVWLCALGAGPQRHADELPFAVRSASAVALRDVADGPRVVSRNDVTRAVVSRLGERQAPGPHFQCGPLRTASFASAATEVARALVTRQEDADAGRARWRTYDAAAPPLARV